MSKRSLVDAWRKGHRSGYKLREVVAEMESHGFTVEQGSRHYRAKHAGLRDCPDFPGGRVVFSAHANGRQGEIDPAAIRDFLRAISWIEGK